ncbi:hypothetical protein ABVT39_002473 [Epinephelus coioides]
MAPAAEIVELKSELRSLEQLIDDLLQRQSVLCSRLARLEPEANLQPLAPAPTVAATKVPGPSSTSSWSFVVRGTKKFSLPLFASPDIGSEDSIPLTNLFSPLASLPLVSPPAARVRKRSSPNDTQSAASLSLSSSSPLQPPPPVSKRPRLSPPQPRKKHPHSASAPVPSSPSSKPPVAAPTNSSPPTPPTREPGHVNTSSHPIPCSSSVSLNSRLSIYKYNPDIERPDILLVASNDIPLSKTLPSILALLVTVCLKMRVLLLLTLSLLSLCIFLSESPICAHHQNYTLFQM